MEEYCDALMNKNIVVSSSLTTPLVDSDHQSHEEHIIPVSTKQTDEESVLDDSYKETVGTSTFFKTCFNGINALSGVGILSVPYALASGGWLKGVLLFVIAAAAFYTGLLMRRCIDASSKIRTYPDIGEYAFGKKGRMMVSSFMYLELVCATPFPNMSFTLAGVRVYGQQGFVILVGLIILPSMWLIDLSKISYGKFFKLNGIPTGVSLYTFCYCAHPVLLLCFVLCTISYGTMAVLGYLMFGENIKSRVTPNLPIDKLGSKIAIYTTLVTPIAKYALMATPIVNAIETSSGFTTTTKLLAHIVALAIPFFGYLMSLVGAFLSATASIIIPCLSGGYELVIIIGIILMGISVVIIGTYTSLEQIASEFKLSS
ncbi:hypothetical protein MKW92_025010 [Papaver armeniacum]|nr:hypothetical protein MKW92_025010 [Papaver armeniacum]